MIKAMMIAIVGVICILVYSKMSSGINFAVQTVKIVRIKSAAPTPMYMVIGSTWG
jgi:hypothetical protein